MAGCLRLQSLAAILPLWRCTLVLRVPGLFTRITLAGDEAYVDWN